MSKASVLNATSQAQRQSSSTEWVRGNVHTITSNTIVHVPNRPGGWRSSHYQRSEIAASVYNPNYSSPIFWGLSPIESFPGDILSSPAPNHHTLLLSRRLHLQLLFFTRRPRDMCPLHLISVHSLARTKYPETAQSVKRSKNAAHPTRISYTEGLAYLPGRMHNTGLRNRYSTFETFAVHLIQTKL